MGRESLISWRGLLLINTKSTTYDLGWRSRAHAETRRRGDGKGKAEIGKSEKRKQREFGDGILPRAEGGNAENLTQRPEGQQICGRTAEFRTEAHTKENEERVAAAGLWLERFSEIFGLLSCEDYEESVHRSAKCPHRAVSCVLRRVGSAHINSAKFGGKGRERHPDSHWILGSGHL